MKGINSFAFVVLAFFADYTYSNNVVPQIKCLGVEWTYKNPEYVGESVFYVTKCNETYNNIHFYWELVKDLPADITLGIQVYVTNDTFKGGKLIFEDSIPLCERSKNRELLSSVYVLDESLLGTGKPCIPKTNYNYKDMGNFRFEVLIPDLKYKGEYYRIDYVYRTKTAVQGIFATYNQWGYA